MCLLFVYGLWHFFCAVTHSQFQLFLVSSWSGGYVHRNRWRKQKSGMKAEILIAGFRPRCCDVCTSSWGNLEELQGIPQRDGAAEAVGRPGVGVWCKVEDRNVKWQWQELGWRWKGLKLMEQGMLCCVCACRNRAFPSLLARESHLSAINKTYNVVS